MLDPLLKEKFPELSEPGLLEEINQHGTIKSFSAGEVIIDYGSFIREVPLLLSGSIKVMRQDADGNEVLLYYVGGGDTCAMSLTCCMAQQQSEVQAIAEEPIQFISLPVRYMDEWMQKYPSWKAFVMRVYKHRFDELLFTIDSIAFMKMDERLMKYLKDKFDLLDADVLEVSHKEIARELGTSREVISRLLKKMEKDGVIELGRNRIKNLSFA